MASQFKNLTVKVSLTDGSTIQGVVTDVANGQLLLSNVYFFSSGTTVPLYAIGGDQVSGIDVITPETPAQQQQHPVTSPIAPQQAPPQVFQPVPTRPAGQGGTPTAPEPLLTMPQPYPPSQLLPSQVQHVAQQTPSASQQTTPAPAIFNDPAILSAGPPAASPAPPPPPPYSGTNAQSADSGVSQKSYFQVSPRDDDDDDDGNVSSSSSSVDSNPYTADVDFEQENRSNGGNHFARRGGDRGAGSGSRPRQFLTDGDYIDSEYGYQSRGGYEGGGPYTKNGYSYPAPPPNQQQQSGNKLPKRSKGKKISSLGQKALKSSKAKYDGQSSGKRLTRNKRSGSGGNNNQHFLPNHLRTHSHMGFESDGWATEDVTDIKDTEFDFQANLDRFDKAHVFDEIRQQDHTLPGERLVAFNKIKGEPSRYQPPEKYGHREMVIQHDRKSRWQGDDENDGRGSDHAITDDAEEADEEDEDDDDVDVDDSVSNISALLTSSPPPLTSLRRPSRPLIYTELKFIASNNGKQVPCASPVQMVELERLTSETFGISETMLTENAGRGVARLALQALGGSSRFTYGNHNSRPLVVVFAGNTRAGARALAAARHLANRQVRIVAVVVGCDEDPRQRRDDDAAAGDQVNPEVRVQIKAVQSCRGKIVRRLDQLIAEINGLDSPPELIIDGLQGYQTTLDDLWEDDVATVVGCIEWANRQKAGVVSLDIPSGIDSATGIGRSRSSKWPHVNARWVLSCGLPLTGIQNAYLSGTVAKGDWAHYVVDVGFPRGALQKGPLRRFGQIWFGAEWLQQLDIVAK